MPAPSAPVSDAFKQRGLPWAQALISVGAITGITSVLLVMMLSQPRVFLAMARDGLLPPGFFGAIHEKFRTPWKSTILTGICVGLMGSFLPLRILAELVNIGTLLAFVIVCAAVLVMRKTNPDAARPFRAPLVPITPQPGATTDVKLVRGGEVKGRVVGQDGKTAVPHARLWIGALSTAETDGGLTFPAFQDPRQLFQLLVGKDVKLIEFDAGDLSASFGFDVTIGPFPAGPVPV